MSGGGGGGGRDDGYQVPRPSAQLPSGAEGGEVGPVGGTGGGGTGSDPDACDIVQTAALNSPQPAVIARLLVGDVLDVALGGSPVRPILEVREPSGAIAGSLTHRGHIAIVDCIGKGNVYVAVVVQRSGGMVTVRVQRR